MSTTWFSVENNLIDRSDLSIYEKMCSVVLARYAGRAEFSNMLNIQVIAIRMGCSAEDAEKALNSLIAKKLVTLESADSIEPETLSVETAKGSGRVIKSELVAEPDKAPAKAFESLESFDDENLLTPKAAEKPAGTAKKKSTRKKKQEAEPIKETSAEKVREIQTEQVKGSSDEPVAPKAETSVRPLVPKQVRAGVQELIDEIFTIVDENINDREARIILSFANNDVDLVREKYKIAKRSQVSDKIEMLINELQRKDEPIMKPNMSKEINEAAKDGGSEAAKEPTKTAHPPKILQNAQIDLENINRMVAFKQNSYGKQNKMKKD